MNQLEYVKNHHGVTSTTTYIEIIPNLLLYFPQEQSTFVVPFHCRHAVLTFTVSCHSGVRICMKSWRTTIDLMKTWMFNHLRDLGRYGDDIRLGRAIFNELYDDVVMWLKLLEMKRDAEMEKTLVDFVEELEDISKRF